MDEADRADAEVELHLQRAILAAAAGRPLLNPNGHCHWCEAPLVSEGQLFCDSDCRDDFDRHLSARARAGRG